MNDWTIRDALTTVYGPDDDEDGFGWEIAICRALLGKVPLATVADVLNYARAAYSDGVRNAMAAAMFPAGQL